MSFLKAISPLGGVVGMGASGLIPAKAIGALGGAGGAAATGLLSPKENAPDNYMQFASPRDRIGYGLNLIAKGGGAEEGYSPQPAMAPANVPQQPVPAQMGTEQPQNILQLLGNHPLFKQLFGRRN